MEQHLKLLEKTCRKCKGIIVLKRGYVTAKHCHEYADLLKDGYGILPNEDKEVSQY